MKLSGWGFVAMMAAAMFCCCGIEAAEKVSAIEAVKSDLEEGLGLTPEQKEKIKVVRESFKARQQEIRRGINAKNELLRQQMDEETPVRANVEAVAAEIKALQGQLIDNRIDVVFKLRAIYTPKQLKMIKGRLEKNLKKVTPKAQKRSKKVKNSKTDKQ